MEFLLLPTGAVIGFLITFLFLKLKANTNPKAELLALELNLLDKKNAVLESEVQYHQNESSKLEKQLHLSESESEQLREELLGKTIHAERAIEKLKAQEEKNTSLKDDLANLHKQHSIEFENLANRILDEKSKKFAEQNNVNLAAILGPFKEQIKDFELKIDKTYKDESNERITLKTEIKHLIDLNKQISEEANNLAKALKGENKTQGNWGELILEKVLERSGLTKGQEYTLQFSANNDDGKRIQPDAIINLPDNKHLIIDAKVSLTAYEALVNETNSNNRDRLLKDHLTSIKTHIKQLSEKKYHSSTDLNTPEFVLLFVPIESSFSIAVQADQELFNFAWDKKIVIVSPSTLLATLLTVSSIWKQERQTKNVIEIAKQSGALYDKFVLFIEDIDKIGKTIDQSRTAFDNAVNKLHIGNGNLVRRIEKIKQLGANTTKQLPEKYIQPNTFITTDD